mgnify:CR=1 FL=1
MQDQEENQEWNDKNEMPFLKQFFLADMGHELRTPMSAILGFSSLLMQSELNETQYKFTQSIYEAADNLLTIINDILDYSKIESGSFQIDKADFSLQELIHNIENRLKRNHRQKNIHFSFNIDEQLPEYLKSDSPRLEQIIYYLMSLVVKFSAHDQVELRTQLISYKNKRVKVRFELGNMEVVPSLENLHNFINNVNGSNGTSFMSHFGDSGLSFYVIKKIINLLDGKLMIEKNENGAQFNCDFDFEVGKSVSVNMNSQKELQGVNVLVCEDNILSQELAKEILQRIGCGVVIAENGKEGVEMLQEANTALDCVLMDIQMPMMDGIEASRSIRALENSLSDIPIIALTAKSINDEKTKYFEAGINDYLTKPFTPQEISQKILQHLPNYTINNYLNTPAKNENASYRRGSHTLFDLDFLKDAFGDNPAIFQELLQVLADQFLQFKKEATNALPRKDWKMLAQAAQVIKVNLVAFGLKSLENKVTLIEQYASRQENLEQVPGLIRDCEEIFAGAIKELNSLLEDGNITEGQHSFGNS